MGTTIIGVVPREKRESWLEAAAEHTAEWLLEDFANVYLVVDENTQGAREIAERYGLQAPILCDAESSLFPKAEGFYRVDAAGIIEEAVGKHDGPHQLSKLFE